MKIIVTRQKSTDAGTPGTLRIEDNWWTCDTLELPWRNNKRGQSCIIADTYKCEPWMSEHLGRMVLRLEDKHGRQDCLVHNGNFAGDTEKGQVTQVHGCTEVGRGFGLVPRPDGKGNQFGILRSKVTLDELMQELGAGPHAIEYKWAEECEPEDLSDLNGKEV